MERKKSVVMSFLTGQVFLSVVCLVVLFFLLKPVIVNVKQKKRINSEIHALQLEIDTVEAKNSDFKKMIDYLESDQFIEEQARLNLNLKRPGEKVVVVGGLAIKDEKNVVAEPLMPKIEKSEKIGLINNVNKWVGYFFEKK